MPENSKQKFDKRGSDKSSRKGPRRQTERKEFDKKKDSDPGAHVPGHNDWSWYAPTETIAKELASIPFNCIVGTPWDNGYTSVQLARDPNKPGEFAINSYNNTETISAVANVLTFNYMLNYGDSSIESTNGINMAAKQLYTYIRKSNSGAKVYEAPDIMMYVCAMREIYALYFKLKKILGLVQFYSNVNRSVPTVLLYANGINPSEFEDVRANYSVYRGQLNLIAQKINSFAMPKYFKVFMRDAFLQSYIFSDSTSLSGQFYNFNLFAIRQWNATTSDKGTSLVPVVIPTSFEGMLNLLNQSLNIMFDDTDVNTMAGDILKAFGDSDMYRVLETDETYVCIPIYDEDVLNQIQNAYYFSLVSKVTDVTGEYATILAQSFLLTQEANNIVTKHSISASYLYNWAPVGSPTGITTYNKLLFNSHKDKPEYTDVLEWSRLSQVIELVSDDSPTSPQLTEINIKAGAELILGSMILIAYGSTSDTILGSGFAPVGYTGNETIRQFDWHPTLYSVHYNGPQAFTTYGGDVKKCTLIDKSTLARMHDCALYSLFNAKTLDVK